MRRILAVLLATLVAWLGLGAPTIAAVEAVPAPATVYTYDSHHQHAVATRTTKDRGPPASCDLITTNGAVDHWSHGASARPSVATTRATYDYDDLARSVQIASRSGGAEGQVGSAVPGSVVVERSDVAAKAGTAGADDVVNGVRLRAQLTGQEIAGGHAFEKHILDLGEFPGIRTRAQFASHIEDVVLNGQMRNLGGGRTAFWRDGTVVIRNPRAPDGGTAFQPRDGYDYFLNQLH